MNEMTVSYSSDGSIKNITFSLGYKDQAVIYFEEGHELTLEDIDHIKDAIKKIMLLPRKKEINDE